MQCYVEWRRKLTHTIDRSIGKIKNLHMGLYKDDINRVFDFWRFLRISEENLKN